MCKLVNIIYDKHFSYDVLRSQGHYLKLNVQGSKINCRQNIINRVAPIWIGLDENVVSSENVSSFSSKLDIHYLNCYCRVDFYLTLAMHIFDTVFWIIFLIKVLILETSVNEKIHNGGVQVPFLSHLKMLNHTITSTSLFFFI